MNKNYTSSPQKVKIIPLGGLDEIGKNMTIFEYGHDVFIVDMGLMFPKSDMPGIDFLLPDISYLIKKKDHIRGIIISHGHLDHTGAIPYLIEQLGFPPIYGTAISMGLVKARLEEFALNKKCQLITLNDIKDQLQLGAFNINTFRLLHNIPGAIGLEIKSPNGRIVLCEDWKFDYCPADGIPTDFKTLTDIGDRGVDLLLSDSTGATKMGNTVSEKIVEQSLANAIKDVNGRLIIAMFASTLTRIQQVLNIAHSLDKKVLFCGRSMIQNVQMAIDLNTMNIPTDIIIQDSEIKKYPPGKIVVISTGSQGERNAALINMAKGKHRTVKISPSDTVMLSASIIPNNEPAIKELKTVLSRTGANIIAHKYLDLDIHASGHASREDLKLMIALMKPKYFMPLHGESFHLQAHRELAEMAGVSIDRILNSNNGSIIEIEKEGLVSVGSIHLPSGFIAVDGKGVGDVTDKEIDERRLLAQEGFVQIICIYNTKTKKLAHSPDIISRGFVYLKDNCELIQNLRKRIRFFIEKSSQNDYFNILNAEQSLNKIAKHYLFDCTGREPMVSTNIIEINSLT